MTDDAATNANDPEAGTDSLDDEKVEPVRAVIGIVPADGDVDDIRGQLTDAGISDSDIRVLEGEQGVDVLSPGGSGVTAALARLLSDTVEFRDQAVAALEQGRKVVVVTDVDDQDGRRVMEVLHDAGLADVHHFGKWAAE